MGTCCISAQPCVHGTYRSVGIQREEQGPVGRARVLLDLALALALAPALALALANKRINDTTPSGRGCYEYVQMCVCGLSCPAPPRP
jgi:hypothetical protein